jgi:hypothetical protein
LGAGLGLRPRPRESCSAPSRNGLRTVVHIAQGRG